MDGSDFSPAAHAAYQMQLLQRANMELAERLGVIQTTEATKLRILSHPADFITYAPTDLAKTFGVYIENVAPDGAKPHYVAMLAGDPSAVAKAQKEWEADDEARAENWRRGPRARVVSEREEDL